MSGNISFHYGSRCVVISRPNVTWTHQSGGVLLYARSEETKFMRRQWTQHRAPYFSPCSKRGGRKKKRGGIWLLSPHPQSVRGGFGKEEGGTKTWDAEITRGTNKEIHIWRSAHGGVAHGLLRGVLFSSRRGDSDSERLIWRRRRRRGGGGRGIQTAREIKWVFHTRPLR